MLLLCLSYREASEADPAGDWPFLDYASSFYGRHGMAAEKAASQAGTSITSISQGATIERSDEAEKLSLMSITKHLDWME